MKNKMFFIVAVGFAIFSCGNGGGSGSSDEISGAYTREYSFKVVNPETGSEIGMRTVRDTIFIRSAENDYEVSNNKWRLNNYDDEGWSDMTHADDRPMSTFKATFNSDEELLRAEAMPDLFFYLENGQLFKGKNRDKAYKKVK